MCDLFKNIPVIIKGVFNFSLKNIANTLYKYKLINTNWGENAIDGLSAMYMSWVCYKKAEDDNCDIKNIPEIYDIINYNEIDCKVMWDILKLLRSFLQ